jgi:transcriptional regulator with XRE-family HTH domain
MGLSQERLAEAVGVDTSTVARWERGETEPQAVHRPRLAEALKVSVETVGELLTGAAARRTAPAYLAPYGLAELSGAGDRPTTTPHLRTPGARCGPWKTWPCF